MPLHLSFLPRVVVYNLAKEAFITRPRNAACVEVQQSDLRCRQKYLEPTKNSWILLLLLGVGVKLCK